MWYLYISPILRSLNQSNYRLDYWLNWFTTTKYEPISVRDEKGKFRDVICPVKYDNIFPYVELQIVDIMEEFGWPKEWVLGKSHRPDSLKRIKTNLCRNDHHIPKQFYIALK